MDGAIEKSAMRKIYMRLLPFAIFVLSGLHRPDQRELRRPDDAGRSRHVRRLPSDSRPARSYWGYFIFEVPSNVIMEKVGARPVDRPHHDHLGHLRRRRPPWSTGRRASPSCASCWASPRPGSFRGHTVLHLLVPEPSPCPHRLGLSDRAADRGGRTGADLDGASGSGRLVRAAGAGRSCTSPRRSRP